MPSYNGVQTQIRRAHEERVLHELRESGPLTREVLGTRVGLSRTTLSEITSDLIARGALIAIGYDRAAPARGRGRRASRVALQPAVGQAMGIDFRHHEVRVAVVNASHEVIAHGARSYAESTDWSQRARRAGDLVGDVVDKRGVRLGRLAGVGIGLPGPLQAGEAGADGASARIDEIRAALREHLDAPLIFDNNTRFAALGEWSANPDTSGRDVLFMRIAHGIGGGLVVDGRLVHGAGGRAGELGHIVVQPGGAMCRCGKRGCLETIASLPSMVMRARRANRALGSLAALRSAVDAGMPDALAVVEAAGDAVGATLAGASMLIDPARLIVEGDAVLNGETFLRAAQRAFDRNSHPADGGAVRIEPGRTGDASGVLGAIAAVFRESQPLQDYAPLMRSDEVVR